MSAVFVATAYGGPQGQQLTEREAPAPGPGEIAIEVRAAGVNPADWKRREGAFGTRGRLPVAMGLEAARGGDRSRRGRRTFAVGDEVLGAPARGLGAFAEHTVLDASRAWPSRRRSPSPTPPTIPVAGTTAYDLTHQVELEAGQILLVIGAGGGVGPMALQIAKVHEFGAIGVASESKRALVEATGATFVPSGDGVADRVREIAPEGVDLLADLVGGEALRELAPLAKDPAVIVSAADAETADRARRCRPGTIRGGARQDHRCRPVRTGGPACRGDIPAGTGRRGNRCGRVRPRRRAKIVIVP